MDFLVSLLGFKIGAKIGNKVYGIGEVLIKGGIFLISLYSWFVYVDVLKRILERRNIGLILLAVILTVALVSFFGFSIYQIETKRAYYSRKFTVAGAAVMAAVFFMEIYSEFGGWNAICILYILVIWTGVWLPKNILRRLEQLGKKSALISEIERQIQKRKNSK